MHRRALGWALTLALLAVAPQGRAGQPAHPGRGGAPAGLCAAGRATPGRPGSPILRTLLIPAGVAVAVDEATGRAFVATHLDDASVVCVLDARTGALLRATPVGNVAEALAVDPLTDRVFVANQGSRSVSVLDARTGRLLRTVPLRGDPHVVTVDAATGRVFLADGNDNLISVLDARSGALLRSVPVALALAVAVSAPPSRVLVGDFEGGSVRVLDARSGAPLHTIPVAAGSQPQSIAVAPAAGRAFVANSEGSVSVLDTRAERLVRSVPVNGLAAEVAADGRTGRVFVTLLPSPAPAVAVLTARDGRVLHTTPLASDPVSTPAIDASTGRVLVLLQGPLDVKAQMTNGPGALVALDGTTGAVRQSILVGAVGGPDTFDLVALDSRTRRAFVSTGAAVFVFDLTRL